MSLISDDIGSVESGQAIEKSIVSDDATSTSNARKVLKVLRDPRLAAALLNAQLCMRGKARLPLSVRLFGRICFRSGGDVKFGNGVCLVGNVTPIEIVSTRTLIFR